MSNKFKKGLLIGALVTALALGVMAFAPLTTASANSNWQDDTSDPPLGNYDEALAEALGITVDELQAAYQTARQAAVQQALDGGKITQEQADRMLAADNDRPFGRDGRFGFGQNGEFLADALGISVEDLQAAQETARAALRDQALADGTITQEQIDLRDARQAVTPYYQEAMKSAYQSAVEQALADGVITHDQADQLLENAANGVGSHDGFGGRPFGGHPAGGHGFHPGQ